VVRKSQVHTSVAPIIMMIFFLIVCVSHLLRLLPMCVTEPFEIGTRHTRVVTDEV
jgi:hypothetical protein